MGSNDYDAFKAHWRLMGNASGTADNYLRCVRRIEIPLAEVTYSDLLAHLAERAELQTASGMQLEVRAMRAFFAWRAEHYDVGNPAAKLKTVKVPELPVRAVTEEEHRQLMFKCTGLSLVDRRDRAILACLWSTGMRRSELAAVELDHLDLEAQTITIPRTKTGKARVVGLDDAAVRALKRYLQARQKHRRARSPKLWISERGVLTSDGMRQAIRERALAAGCEGVSAHTYRRALAERWLRVGGSESLLRAYAGWSSPAMVMRYTRGHSQQLALTEHRRLMA